MARQSSSADSSLPLHEVLEAEFVALHGKLPPDYPSSREPKTRLKELWAAIHGLKEKHAALCISGGGIRSATFGLGILQGLARCGLLDKFHYLSTVSGGGYIGSWLSAWIKNDREDIRGVVDELKRRPDSTLNPEPQPIRHLREFSNYLAPRTGLTSVDFWTLITTFIRNMFLNWLVLISWLAAAMMIPRLYLAAINLQPDWVGLATRHSWYLLANNLPPDWASWADSIKHPWNFGLTIMLGVAFLLVAIAMAYAIIDVPSTGNARLSQRRFLKFRQLPLFLASLILAAWWAVFCNVHGKSGAFQDAIGLLKLVVFIVSAYVCGQVLARLMPSFRKREHKPRPGSVWRFFAILVTTVFAGFCLWAMATRMFLDHKQIEFTLKRACEATQIPSEEKMTLPQGTTGVVTRIVEGTYTVGILGADQAVVRIPEKDLDASLMNQTSDSKTNLKKFTFRRGSRAIQIPSGKETPIPKGTEGEIIENVESSYTVETDQVSARVAKKDFDAFELKPAPDPQADWIKFRLKRICEATDISTRKNVTLPAGITGAIRQIGEETYTVETDRVTASITKKDFDAVELRRPLPAPANYAVAYVCFAPALIMAVVMLVNFLFTGLASWVSEDEDREWWARSAAWIAITIVTWVLVNAIVLWGGQAITASGNQIDVFLGQLKANPVAKAILGVFGGVSGIAGALLALRSKLGPKLGKKVGLQWVLVFVAVVFFVLLAVVISWVLLVVGGQPWVHQVVAFLGHIMADKNGRVILVGSFVVATAVVGVLLVLRSNLSKRLILSILVAVVIWWILLLIGSLHLAQQPNDWRAQIFIVVFLMGVILLFGIVMGFLINANKFSLHATYRNRLIRAYLAASRTKRRPNRFTGFDPDDNFELHKLPPGRPLHVLNGALNLVTGEQLAWQERKAESFTMSRLYCGSWNKQVGYRHSAEYGDGITLGTAMAISGAAANPNMGYHSSPVVGFLMALFNVRLGWWLGNPGAPGAKTWRRSGPGYSVGPLFSEALGRTTDSYKYVNLSDGGHFENLGLYEMVLRRCHFIVVSDGGEDPECTFADLGEAVRKIRIDFGIPIEFGTMNIFPRSAVHTQKTSGRCAIGRILYSVVDGDTVPDGVIIYIKPACYGDEPRDIYEYSKRNETFPHESTGDQFFSESQFESYRMLGVYTMEKLCTDCDGDFRCFIRDILQRHLQAETPVWLEGLLEETTNEIA
ncbi:MAG TPA: patatin-like phospholipase family protein [Candidatus Udaeobacter sp.]|nr:patatin-like phospholipase family protein [Candidatus Udaeobacter sp.]